MKRILIASTAALLLLIAAGGALAESFVIRAGEPNRVSFLSKAPMETVEGSTSTVSGSVEVDLADLAAGVDVAVKVDLASIDTGIKLRNRHMCENHLETDEYPEATFVASAIETSPGATLEAGGSAEFSLKGDFTLHGVTREIEVPVAASLNAAGELHVTAEFKVKLSDYEIKRPKFLVLKLDEVQNVRIDLVAVRGGTNG